MLKIVLNAIIFTIGKLNNWMESASVRKDIMMIIKIVIAKNAQIFGNNLIIQ